MASTISDTKRVAKNTLVLYVRMFVMILIGLYTSRIVLNTLGVEDYGIYNVVGGIVVLLSCLNAAMAGATQRFINIALGKQNIGKLKKIINNSFILHYIIAFLILFLAETVGLWFINTYLNIAESRIVAANWVYQFSVMSFLVTVIQTPYNACIIAHEKMTAFAWITLSDMGLKLIIVFSLLFIPYDKLILYSVLLFIGANVTRLIYKYYCRSHFEECKIIKWSIDKSLLKSMSSFSGWTILGNLSYIGHTQGIAILINIFFGVSVNAAQGIANQVNGLVKQFVSNFTLALNPQIVKLYASQDIASMHKMIFRGCKIAILMVAVFTIPLCLETNNILKLWLKIVPDYTIIFVRLILLITLTESFSGPLATSQGATGNIRNYQLTLTTIGLMHFPITWICFASGMDAYSTQYIYLILTIIIQIVRTIWVSRSVKYSLRLFLCNVVGRCVLAISMASIIPIYMHIVLPNSIISSICVCTIYIISLALSSICIAFDKTERSAIFSMLKLKFKH